MKSRILPLVLAAFVAVLTGCGGGGGGTLAGIDRLGVSSGPITGFGSIKLGGRTYLTNCRGGPTVEIDDQSGGSVNSLLVGQIVTIDWRSSDNGATFCAENVVYDDTIEGPVTAGSIDVAAGTFGVLGQTVVVDGSTSLDPDLTSGLDSLVAGDIVEVSGLIRADGQIFATRVELKTSTTEFELRGIVTNLTATTFQINGFTVEIVGAVFPDGAIANGDFVEAKGPGLVGGQLNAASVEIEDQALGGGGEDGDDGEIEGFVTSIIPVANPASTFEVSGTRVLTDGSTQYENGTAASIAVNVKVEVEGEFNASGVLVADKVKIKAAAGADEAEVRIEANVAAISVANGTVSLLGITVQVDANTRLEDQRSNPVQPFGLGNLAAGNYVEIRGVKTGANTVRATLLQREDPDTEGTLRGPLAAIADPDFSILGVPVDTDGGTEFFDEFDDGITALEFFGLVLVDDIVKVRFTQAVPPAAATPIQADEVEIERLVLD